MRLTTFSLFDWRRPMKCQRTASPYSAYFASRSCARFSPTTSTPASTSTARSGSGTYLVAATTVTRSPTCACTRARRSRSSGGDSTHESLRPAAGPVAAVREEQIGVAARAQIDPLDVLDARTEQSTLSRGPQIQDPAGRQVAVEELRDLRSDLVAARACRGPDDRRLRAAADRSHTRRDDTLGQAAPPRVQDGERRPRAVAGDRDRHAIGGQREHRQLGLVAPQPVARLAARAAVRAVHRRRVTLPVDREARRVEPERRAGPPTVLLDPRRVVALAAEVERGVRAGADTAGAGRERDDDPGARPRDQRRRHARIPSQAQYR